MIKVVTVVGARPQFIKAAAVSRVIRDTYADQVQEILVHTGQHFDENMSKVFFDELDIPKPNYNLEISGGSHGLMTGRMLEAIEQVLLKEKPDWVLVYGDTNSTLAGALAAVKLHIRVAHVEAGLRSFNMRMPEEVNRVMADRISTLLFCPTEAAVKNLQLEGVKSGVINSGDVMYDVALTFRDQARQRSTVLQRLGLTEKAFTLATCHRAENTDDPTRLKQIMSALGSIANDLPVVLPLHPRTRKLIYEQDLQPLLDRVTVLEPVAFLDMVALEQAAKLILTDSGGVQKEAFFYRVPCVTMREETEWVETVHAGMNMLVGADTDKIIQATIDMQSKEPANNDAQPYGNGRSAFGIVDALVKH